MTKHYPKPSKQDPEDTLIGRFSGAAGDIKGRWTEEFLKVVFKNIGLETIDTGVEDTHSRLAWLRSQNKISFNVLAGKRKSPDMAVILPLKTGQQHQKVIDVEVKYRDKGKIKVSELMEYQHLFHDNFRFVFFDRFEIYTLDPKDIAKKTKTLFKGTKNEDDFILFKHCTRLRNSNIFEFSPYHKDMVAKFEKMSHALFSGLPEHQNLVGKIKQWIKGSYMLKFLQEKRR